MKSFCSDPLNKAMIDRLYQKQEYHVRHSRDNHEYRERLHTNNVLQLQCLLHRMAYALNSPAD